MAGLTVLSTPATVLTLLSSRRGEAVVTPVAARFGSALMPGAVLICCSAARGERNASLAMTLIVATTATLRVIRRVRVFIFNFVLFWCRFMQHRLSESITPLFEKPRRTLFNGERGGRHRANEMGIFKDSDAMRFQKGEFLQVGQSMLSLGHPPPAIISAGFGRSRGKICNGAVFALK